MGAGNKTKGIHKPRHSAAFVTLIFIYSIVCSCFPFFITSIIFAKLYSFSRAVKNCAWALKPQPGGGFSSRFSPLSRCACFAGSLLRFSRCFPSICSRPASPSWTLLTCASLAKPTRSLSSLVPAYRTVVDPSGVTGHPRFVGSTSLSRFIFDLLAP